jgi:tetratricopeptide (TPR) repeat protein
MTMPHDPQTHGAHRDAGTAETIQILMESAERKAAAGDLPAAIAELRRALTLDPDSPFLLKTLGGLLVETGSFAEAQQQYRHLLRLQPERADFHVLSAIASLKMGRLDEFDTSLGRSLELNPAHLDALRWRSRVAFDNGQHAEAGRDYARLVELGQVDPDTLTALGVCLARGGHWQIAAETFARAVVTHGTAEIARENLGVALGKSGRDPRLLDPTQLLQRAAQDVEEGFPALACWAWLEVLRLRPKEQEARRNLVSVLLAQRWIGPALPHLEELVRFNPWDPALGTWLALARHETGQKAAARQALDAVFNIDPRFLEGRRLEVDIALREGRHQEAWWLVQRLCENHPEDPIGRISRGVCAFHLEHWDDAERDFRWVLQRQPDNHLVRQNLEAVEDRQREAARVREERDLRSRLDEAGKLQASGDLEGAVGLLEPILKQRPDWAEAWDALGALRFLRGNAEGARECLLQANRLSPGLPDLQVRLAMACQACGREGEAVALVDQIVGEQPAHVPAQRLRGDLLLGTEPAAAVEAYAACLRNTPGVCDDLLRLGVAHLQSRRLDAAQSLFSAVLAIQPDHPVALRAQAKLAEGGHA